MVELLNLYIEKEQFIINFCCILMCELHYTPIAAMRFYEFKLLIVNRIKVSVDSLPVIGVAPPVSRQLML